MYGKKIKTKMKGNKVMNSKKIDQNKLKIKRINKK